MPDPVPSPIQIQEHELYGEVGGGWRRPRWATIRRRLARARYYWIAVATPSGALRTVPVWAVWHNDALYASIGTGTVLGRSLAARDPVVAHLPAAGQVVVVEGRMSPLEPAAVPPEVVDAYDA